MELVEGGKNILIAVLIGLVLATVYIGKLQNDYTADTGKWDACKDEVTKLTKDIKKCQKHVEELQGNFSRLQETHNNMKIECKKNETILDIIKQAENSKELQEDYQDLHDKIYKIEELLIKQAAEEQKEDEKKWG